MAWYTITINDNGGSGSSPKLFYYHTTSPVAYYKSKSTDISNIFNSLTKKPTRKYFEYNGHWTSKSGGVMVIAPNGMKSSGYPIYSGDTTIYADWTRLSYLLAFNKSSGTGGTTAIYGKATEGGWYSNWECTAEVSAITPPTRDGYVFIGYYSGHQDTDSGFTKYINADGTFTDAGSALVLTENTTMWAWWKARYDITVEANGGTGGTAAFYYVPTDAAFYSDAACTNAITAITMPTKSESLSVGCYATDSVEGVLAVEPDGTIAAGWAPAANATIYAQWRTVVEITLDMQGGESGTPVVVYDSIDDSFHAQDTTEELSGVVTPNMECYRFLGYFSQQSGGTKYIDADGTFTADLYALTISAPFTVYAQWEFVSYKATLAPGEGVAYMLAFYCDGSAAAFYADDLLAGDPITSVPVPVRPGYSFTGYWNGDVLAVSALGVIQCGAFDAAVTYYAQYVVRTYTATFDYNGGSGGVNQKTVTWNEAIGSLPTPSNTPSRANAEFGGWQIDGETVNADTVWRWDGDKTLRAKWITGFQYVEDFFNLGSANLVPIASESGDNKMRVCVMNATTSSGGSQTGAGRYSRDYSNSSRDPSATSGIWRNPTVTYLVVRDCTVSVRLGKAFPATKERSEMTVSGYMITSVRVRTSIGSFPTITVSAVANEGADAINLFDVSIPVLGRARPQCLLGAFSGGGDLQSCDAEATCNPVVVAENNMPCASDVVGGRLVVSAVTAAPNHEAAPAAANGFTSVGEPKSNGDIDYPTWSFMAEKEIV